MSFSVTKIRIPRKPATSASCMANNTTSPDHSPNVANDDNVGEKPKSRPTELKVQTWEIHGAF